MQVVNMDENFLMEDLFAKGGGGKSLDELREDLEWRVAEYYDKYEDLDQDEEPVIRPCVLFMLDFIDAQEHFRWELNDIEREETIARIWQDRIYREEKRRNEKKMQLGKD